MSLILKYDLGNPHRLPVGYTPLAYIESTGTQYINTGWVPGVDSKIDTTIIPSDNSALSPANPITCIYTSDNKLIFEYFINKNEQTLYYSVNGVLGASTNGNKSVSDGKFIGPLHCVYTTDKFICNGETLVSSSKPTIETSYNCYIFAYNNKGTIDSRHIACKLYSFKGFDNNTLVRDFIPARRNSDGIIGLFDCVSQTFFTNQGTGAFIAGPEVVVLPYEYLLVEYLENNGTQRINTGYAYDSTNNTYHVLCLFLMISAYSSYQGVYGAYTAEANSCFRLLRANNNTNLLINSNSKAGGGGTSLNVSSIFNLLESDHTYDTCTVKNRTNNTTYTATVSHSNVGTSTTSTFFVFDQSSGSTPSAERIYYFKLYTGTTLVRNMIPCYRRSDLKPGMYDLVNKVFYTNAGTGEFILGPVVEESSRQLEYNQTGCGLNLWKKQNVTIPSGFTLTINDDGFSNVYPDWDTSKKYIIENILTRNGVYTVSGKYKQTYTEDRNLVFYLDDTQIGSIASANNEVSFSFTFTVTDFTTQLFKFKQMGGYTGYIKDFKLEFENINTGYGNTLIGFPTNVHHSTSNPSSTLINLGSGKFGTDKSYLYIPKETMTGLTLASISLWLNIESFNTTWATYFHAGTRSTAWAAYIFGLLRNSSNSNVTFCISNGSSATYTNCTSPNLLANTWYHIVMVYKTGHILLYINGSLHLDYSTSIVPNFSGITEITIGMNNDKSSYLTNCCISDFRIYDNVLTADEVLKIYKGGL